MFNYFTVSEIDKFTFYRIPKLLITDEKFKKLSCESKLLYGLLLDRASLSKKYRWIDEHNRIYVYFKQDEAQEMLNIGVGKAVKIFNELEEIGLILRKKQGQGKPTKVYVMNFADVIEESENLIKQDDLSETPQTSSDVTEKKVKTSKNRKSELSDSETEVKTSENRKSKLTKIESLPFYIENKTEMSKTNQSFRDDKTNRKSENNVTDRIDRTDMENAVNNVKNQIDYNSLPSSSLLDEIVHTMAWTYVTPQAETPVSGVRIDTPLVVERFKTLTNSHIRLLMDKLCSSKTQIINIQNYLLTCLYNAPVVIDLNSSTNSSSSPPNSITSSFSIEDLVGLSMFND